MNNSFVGTMLLTVTFGHLQGISRRATQKWLVSTPLEKQILTFQEWSGYGHSKKKEVKIDYSIVSLTRKGTYNDVK